MSALDWFPHHLRTNPPECSHPPMAPAMYHECAMQCGLKAPGISTILLVTALCFVTTRESLPLTPVAAEAVEETKGGSRVSAPPGARLSSGPVLSLRGHCTALLMWL